MSAIENRTATRFLAAGVRHLLTFMIRSGRKVPTPAIPMPDLAVPYAAPMPARRSVSSWGLPQVLPGNSMGWERPTAEYHGGRNTGLLIQIVLANVPWPGRRGRCRERANIPCR